MNIQILPSKLNHRIPFLPPQNSLLYIPIILFIKNSLQILHKPLIWINHSQNIPIHNTPTNILPRQTIHRIILKNKLILVIHFQKINRELRSILNKQIRRVIIRLYKKLNKGHLKNKVVVHWHFLKETF